MNTKVTQQWCRRLPVGIALIVTRLNSTREKVSGSPTPSIVLPPRSTPRESAELARIRKKLKLTQLEAARITGGGPNAFSRYERGKARPLPAVTNLFRLLDRHPELLDELQN
jgi:HTH-type transcriptional regulator/antitoxin MqsA